MRSSRILFGEGRLRGLGELVASLGGSRALLVTDSGIQAAGHVGTAVDSLAASSVRPFVFDGVEENPTTQHVELTVAVAKRRGVDFLVGLGGGSAMDTAKAANMLLAGGGRMADHAGLAETPRRMLPSVGVPCTAGTGSEAQSFAVITDEESGAKMACGAVGARYSAVILDSSLPQTAPAEVAAAAGFDALSHAVESYVTRTRNPFSALFAREAWKLLTASYELAVAGCVEATVWGDMLLGAHLAGQAIESSMLGAAHALANPLTTRFGVSHGRALALLLPFVVRANSTVVSSCYQELLDAAGITCGMGGEGLAVYLEELRRAGGLPERLAEVGVETRDLAQLVEQALGQWTLDHNPRPLHETELREALSSIL